MAPPPKLTISQWADRFRKLSSEASAEPGQWLTSRAEYQRGIMDTISNPKTERVVIMTSSQVGKTEILSNTVGFHIAQDPAPILILQPTLDMAETFAKDRLAPMLRDTPALQNKVSDPRSRDSGNTMLHKQFTGGAVTVVGANSAAGLASRPIRVVLADEVDRYPPSAGSEGDPLSLAIKRTTTFWNRRVVMVSTPTVKGVSRIEAEWTQSDQRRYFVPCPHCDAEQSLVWTQVKWPSGEPHRAAYHCEGCGAEWSDAQRLQAIRKGQWKPTNADGRFPGFHLNELYSPWSTPARMAEAFVEAKRSPETLKTWINTSLGETWEEDAEKVDHHSLASRLEDWGKAAPEPVLVVTCGIDIQADRAEIERVGWSADEQSWSLDYQVIWGDPTSPMFWQNIDDYLLTPSPRVDGVSVEVMATCIDTGFHTQKVYEFAGPRFRRGVYAVKGLSRPGTPIWSKKPSKQNRGAVRLFTIGVDAAKDLIYQRLGQATEGPGYCHFPTGRDFGYFEMLTAEKVRTKYSKGFPQRVYELPSGKRNEALDCRVYAYAAFLQTHARWRYLAQQQHLKAAPRKMADMPDTTAPASWRERLSEPPQRTSPQQERRPGNGWIDSRKDWLR